MAGLGETCSHVASLLWATAAGVEKWDSLTVTQKSAYWVMPPAIKSVPYAQVGDIKFIGKKPSSSTSDSLCHLPAKKYDPWTVLPIQSESDELFSSLAECDGAKPAVLVIVPPYCDRYIPAALAEDLLFVLSDLYQKEYLSLGYRSLLQVAHNTQLSLTTAQTKAVEAKTRGQAKSRIWYRMRAGRITAPNFKRARCIDPADPSKSLIMSGMLSRDV